MANANCMIWLSSCFSAFYLEGFFFLNFTSLLLSHLFRLFACFYNNEVIPLSLFFKGVSSFPIRYKGNRHIIANL